MELNATILIHLDYGNDEHGYVLYRVPESLLDDARTAVDTAWDKYEKGGRQGCIEETVEKELYMYDIPFSSENYEPIRIVV